jgi:outer membrane protein assembly factor BamB
MVMGDIVYCASFDDIEVFDSHTGKYLWHQPFNTSEMLLNAGVLYINDSATPNKPGIAALRAKDGKKLWWIASSAGMSYQPFLGLKRGILYTIANNGVVGSIDALRVSDGTRLWHVSVNGDATKVGAVVA